MIPAYQYVKMYGDNDEDLVYIEPANIVGVSPPVLPRDVKLTFLVL